MKFCNYGESRYCLSCVKREKCIRHHEKHIKRKIQKQVRKAIIPNYIGDIRNARPEEF